jgi:L-lactate dehydrogenase complex protein LldG
MTARDDTLQRLHIAQHPEPHPEPWESPQSFPDLTAQFMKALQNANGKAFHVKNLGEAREKAFSLMEDFKVRRIVANHEPPLDQLDLPARYSQYEWHIVGKTEGNLREFCAHADAGLTGAEAGFAETGSLVLVSGPGKSRFTSLLPPLHIVLVQTSKLTVDIFAWQKSYQKQFPGWVGFISGPSKTGDIEGKQVLGVHGPRDYIVILYDE